MRLPVGLDLLDGLAARQAPQNGVQHVLGDDGRPPCLPLAGGGVEPFQGRLADVLPLGLRHRREECEQQLAVPAGVIHSREGAGEHIQHQALGEQVVGERGMFGGVAAEPLSPTP